MASGTHAYSVQRLIMERIVLDTNCLISALKRSSIYYPIWREFINGKYCLCFSDDILDEYQEIIEQRTGSSEIARNVISAILNRDNIQHIEVYYRFDLIQRDKDDNKFVDCAIKADAKYIVSNDRHFKILNAIPFPHIEVITNLQFLEILKE